MHTRHPPELEMNLAGEFVSPPKPPVSAHIMVWAVAIAAIGAAVSIAAFALWIALTILPFVLGAAAIAWAMFRFRIWQAQKQMGRQRQVWRP
jgi:hypothetical protein